MRKIKRLTSIFLSALIVFSMTAVAVNSISAAEISDESGVNGTEMQISFDVKKSGWNLDMNKKFYCHFWKSDGSKTSSGTDWPEWQTRKERCD